jgi:hypothetical protein
MAAKPKPGGDKAAGRKEIHPGIIVDQINKELGRQRDFGKSWGALISPDFPTTLGARLALRKAELRQAEEAAAAASGAAPASMTTTTRAAFANPRSLEEGLKGAYRQLKAGV